MGSAADALQFLALVDVVAIPSVDAEPISDPAGAVVASGRVDALVGAAVHRSRAFVPVETLILDHIEAGLEDRHG